jgi:hypothetical protein
MESSLSSIRTKSPLLYGHSAGHCGLDNTFSAMELKVNAIGYRNPGTLPGKKALTEVNNGSKQPRDFCIV